MIAAIFPFACHDSKQDDPSSSFLNNEMIGIEMGAEIFNLSHTIDIHYKKVDKVKEMTAKRHIYRLITIGYG